MWCYRRREFQSKHRRRSSKRHETRAGFGFWGVFGGRVARGIMELKLILQKNPADDNFEKLQSNRKKFEQSWIEKHAGKADFLLLTLSMVFKILHN